LRGLEAQAMNKSAMLPPEFLPIQVA
jgi:hypothetical protein